MSYWVKTREELRTHYAPAIERAQLKTLRHLDVHCQRFIALSPFVCLGTAGTSGADVTPRGDRPGFVAVLDDRTLALPDWRGNNRLDSLENVVGNPEVALLFLIPGVDETLRVNGTGAITVDPAVLARWQVDGKQPASALIITVREAYLHCGKAFIRSKLWAAENKVERSALPSYGQMLKDQIAVSDTVEEMEASIAHAYRERLY